MAALQVNKIQVFTHSFTNKTFFLKLLLNNIYSTVLKRNKYLGKEKSHFYESCF